MNTWILVGNATRAKLYATSEGAEAWTRVQAFEHPESRRKGSELVADAPGRQQQSAGAGHRPAMAHATDPKEVEAERFASELAELLANGHGHHAYDRLVLVAPPHFLGLLRKQLPATVTKLVSASLDKDYTQMDDVELPIRLAEALALDPPAGRGRYGRA